jgi:SOS response regulatory protein OraA/RecX
VDAKALDDERYAERFARERLTHGGVGRHRVRQALFQRGVPRNHAEHGLASALDQVSEAESVERLARLYWSRRSEGEPRERLRRLWALLLRRGFPADLVRTRLLALWPKWRDALDGLDPVEHEPEQEQG